MIHAGIKYGRFVVNSSMTGPAVLAVRFNPGYNPFMASDAIGFDKTFSMIGNFYGFDINGRVEIHKIFCTVNALPEKMADEIVVGQMTVNALDGSVHAGHEPRLILVVHDMATVAEFRGGGQRDYPRRNSSGQNAESGENHRRCDHQLFTCHRKIPCLYHVMICRK
jgi:hypothetical protein